MCGAELRGGGGGAWDACRELLRLQALHLRQQPAAILWRVSRYQRRPVQQVATDASATADSAERGRRGSWYPALQPHCKLAGVYLDAARNFWGSGKRQWLTIQRADIEGSPSRGSPSQRREGVGNPPRSELVAAGDGEVEPISIGSGVGCLPPPEFTMLTVPYHMAVQRIPHASGHWRAHRA